MTPYKKGFLEHMDGDGRRWTEEIFETVLADPSFKAYSSGDRHSQHKALTEEIVPLL